MLRIKRFGCKFIISILALSFVFAWSTVRVYAFTSDDADTAMEAFNKNFWNPKAKYYRRKINGVKEHYWKEALYMENIMDAYERTNDSNYLKFTNDIYDGFISEWGTTWSDSDSNDDIMWWILACTRAYQLTDDAKYLNQARKYFDWMYEEQCDSTLGGGIWWNNRKHETKNSCVNGPSVIAAVNLYNILGDASYLSKAEKIYEWQRNTLFDSGIGVVWDHIKLNGTISNETYTYNQGSFIGAAVSLYKATNNQLYLDDAIKATEYAKNNMCENGILKNETATHDQPGFKAILCRYIFKLIRECGQEQYIPWMQLNADSVWNNRRLSDNIMWGNWAEPAPADNSISNYAWAAHGGVALLQLCPATGQVTNRMADSIIEAETYNGQQGIYLDNCSEGGKNIGGIKNDDYTLYENIDFGSGDMAYFKARVASANNGGVVEIRLDDLKGTLIGTCSVYNTGGDQSWNTVWCSVEKVTGVHNLYLVYKGSDKYLFNVNWVTFCDKSMIKDPYSRIEAECFDGQSGTIKEECSEGGQNIGGIMDGNFTKYDNLDFTKVQPNKFEVRAASANKGGSIEIRLDSTNGKLIGTCPIAFTWGDQMWKTFYCDIESEVTGTHDVYLVYKGNSKYLFNVNWFRFNY